MGLGFRNFPQDGLGRHIATLDGLIWPWAALYGRGQPSVLFKKIKSRL